MAKFKVGDRVRKVRSSGLSLDKVPLGFVGTIVGSGLHPGDTNYGMHWNVRYDGWKYPTTDGYMHCSAFEWAIEPLVDTWAKDKVAYVINSQDALIGTDKRDLLVTK